MPHDYPDFEDRPPPFNANLASEQGVDASAGYNVPLAADQTVAGYKSTAVSVDGNGGSVAVEVGWRLVDDVSGIVAVESKTLGELGPETGFFINQGDVLDHVTLSGGADVDYSVIESNQLPLPPPSVDIAFAHAFNIAGVDPDQTFNGDEIVNFGQVYQDGTYFGFDATDVLMTVEKLGLYWFTAELLQPDPTVVSDLYFEFNDAGGGGGPFPIMPMNIGDVERLTCMSYLNASDESVLPIQVALHYAPTVAPQIMNASNVNIFAARLRQWGAFGF